ncbi:Av71 muscle cell intermediate filament [Culex quinquefasciatus]|uniref:Av71 muscle cell intermediate filament n=1 Tax=Culex quinquefasciatus TaxID=7176 RepID=B0WQ87_CULQU|nr:Av71 muscle cell intermediate filament [Culex quinquefasciatus]|eukprot:XP_001850871.1 Av71 muscle cell intermediate filament [Culex quinquefasciatus]
MAAGLAEWLSCPLCKRKIMGSIPICSNLPSDWSELGNLTASFNQSSSTTASKSCICIFAPTSMSVTFVVKVRSQESGVRSQKSGVRSQESGVRSQESGVRSQESGVRSQESGVRSQESGVRSQES